MTHEDQLLELFGQANPVPDPTAYTVGDGVVVPLASDEQGSNPMQGTKIPNESETKQKTSTRWALGIAAALIAVVGVGAILASSQEPDDVAESLPLTELTAPDTPPETVPTTTVPITTIPVIDPSITALMDALDARNEGDLDTFLASLRGEALSFFTNNPTLTTVVTVANEQYAFPEGCDARSAPGGDTIVECFVVQSDDFRDVAGVRESGELKVWVTDDGAITQWRDGIASNDQGELEEEFFFWMEVEHPDEAILIEGGFGPNGDQSERTSEEMTIALKYVKAFVAQSDRYPLTP